jgi:putative folate metabolism gamma-glutamate ligase
MKVNPLKTKVISSDDKLDDIVKQSIGNISEGSILVITSKVVALTEGNTCKIGEVSKKSLIEQEADFYLDSDLPYGLTIKDSVLIPAAGIDESNSDGRYVFWPKDPYGSARKIRNSIAKKYKLENFGVIITDSRTSPLRWGTTGISVGYAGFKALKDYRNKKDIFGRKLKVTQANIVDALASAAVLIMGEGNEQTPMAIIEDIPFIEFDVLSPTKKGLVDFKIDMKEDLYGPLLNSVSWKKGK